MPFLEHFGFQSDKRERESNLITGADRACQALSGTSVTISEIDCRTDQTWKNSSRTQRYSTSFEINKHGTVPFVLKTNRLVVVSIKNIHQIFELNESFCFDFDYNQSAIFLSELNTDQIEDNKTSLANLFFRKIQ